MTIEDSRIENFFNMTLVDVEMLGRILNVQNKRWGYDTIGKFADKVCFFCFLFLKNMRK